MRGDPGRTNVQIKGGTTTITLHQTGNLPGGVYFVKAIKDTESGMLRLFKE